jgi:ribosomal protein S18 acetylase RimI-like enzyme
VTRTPGADPPRPATSARPDDLLELLQTIRRELRLRGEDLQGAWVEQVAGELKAGRQPGWFYAPTDGRGGLAFGNSRADRAWGHLHATEEADAIRLATALLDGIEGAGTGVTLGFTGLTVEAERRLLDWLSRRPGASVIERFCMVRTLRPDDAAVNPPVPAGFERAPVRDVTLAALADLDWRAFRGSTDDRLVGGSVEEYARVLTGLLDNSLGLFLDAASTALLQPDPLRLVGGILTAEVSAHEAVFVDIMVDPDLRRRGLARFLLRWAVRGYDQVRLWVTASNVAALRFYEAEGFRRIAATRIYRWDRPGEVEHAHRSR